MDLNSPLPPEWKLNLTLDNETRMWKLEGFGPAAMLKHFLVDIDDSVIEHLKVEAEFDSIMASSET